MHCFELGRKTAVAIALSVAGTLLACEEPEAPPVEVIRPVKVLEITGAGGGTTREYPGRIKAGQYSEMSFEVPGKVTEFIFTEGTPVDAGAVLARLDPRDYKADYDKAVAKLKHSESERSRYKEMYEKEVKPYSEYEVRMRQYDFDEAALRQAKKALDDTTLRAPFSGVMARKLVEEFENVLAKQPVLVMQNDDLLELKVSVPERDLASGSGTEEPVDELTRVFKPRVVVSSLPGRSFPARVKELANVADPTTRTFEATFLFDNTEDVNILGGMTAKIVIDIPPDEAEGGIRIPSTAAISRAEGRPIVFVIDPSTMQVSSREVELGSMSGGEVNVLTGIGTGDTIVVSGVHSLSDGMTVRALE